MNLFSLFSGGSAPSVDAVTAQNQLQGPSRPFLLDVREPEEYAQAHIPGARLIPLGDLTRRLGELPREREIIAVCRSGNRSGTAVRHLMAAGLKATNLAGGMIAWSRAGLPIKQGMGK